MPSSYWDTYNYTNTSGAITTNATNYAYVPQGISYASYAELLARQQADYEQHREMVRRLNEQYAESKRKQEELERQPYYRIIRKIREMESRRKEMGYAF
jgi:hypothetical protein